MIPFALPMLGKQLSNITSSHSNTEKSSSPSPHRNSPSTQPETSTTKDGIKGKKSKISSNADLDLPPPPLLARANTFSARKYPTRLLRRKRKRAPSTLIPQQNGFVNNDDDDALPQRKTVIDSVRTNAQNLREKLIEDLTATSEDSPQKSTTVFPQYDNLWEYSIHQAQYHKLLTWEIDRLINVIAHPEIALRFAGQTYLTEGSKEGHKNLSTLSRTLVKVQNIIALDNTVIEAQNCPALFEQSKMIDQIRKVRTGLLQTNDCIIVEENTTEVYTESCIALIDFITAVFTRHIVQSGSGSYWIENIVGIVVKWSAKAKVIVLDLHTNALISLASAEGILFDMVDEKQYNKDGGDDDDEEVEEALANLNDRTTGELRFLEDAKMALYCAHQAKFRSGLDMYVRYILASLQYLNRSGFPVYSYDVCSVVYETGFEGFKSLLFQDRDYEFTATSDLHVLNTSHSAFKILDHTLTDIMNSAHLTSRPPSSSNATQNETLFITLEWRYQEDDDEKDGITRSPKSHTLNTHVLTCMEDIVSAMVLLAAASPVVSANLNSFRNLIALTGDIDDEVRPLAESSFTAFFRMYTNAHEGISHKNVLQLSHAVKQGLFSREALIAQKELSLDQLEEQKEATSRKWASLKSEMDGWIIDEFSVTVNCTFYVHMVMLGAFLLISGGIVIGMTVGERIVGVDPFNLTTYAWVLALFLIVIAKSVKVETWSWRDFLLRRVTCRSVSELVSVTGINEQLIIAKLLHDEKRTPLTTRGPFNSVFTRKSADGSGFSIDCAITTRTMLLSGLTLLKVVTPEGHALVCLDARRGTDLVVVEHQGLSDKERLVCDDLRPKTGKSDYHSSTSDRRFLQLADLRWTKVHGVFNDLDASFV